MKDANERVMSIDDGGSAFPVPGNPHTQPGMTLRDYFAGQYLAGIAASSRNEELSVQRACREAYAHADAMLAARKAVPQ